MKSSYTYYRLASSCGKREMRGPSRGIRKDMSMDEARIAKYEGLRAEIGHTPLHEVKSIVVPNGNRIFAKEEYLNPTGSHYDRVFVRLFEALEEQCAICPGQSL